MHITGLTWIFQSFWLRWSFIIPTVVSKAASVYKTFGVFLGHSATNKPFGLPFPVWTVYDPAD